MMAQFDSVKERFPDSILFFRMGDFYEMFRQDAVVASKILGIALTKRGKNTKNEVQMCGVPHHSFKQYAMKLIREGYHVAICDQLEDPAIAKGLVRRGVTRVISPSTVFDAEELPDASNNFLAAIYQDENSYFIAAADISTGEVYLTETNEQSAIDVLSSFQPKEILCSVPMRFDFAPAVVKTFKTLSKACAAMAGNYRVRDIEQLGVSEPRLSIPFEMIAAYVSDEAMLDISYVRPKILVSGDYLVIDRTAAHTLELTDSSDGRAPSLFDVLNYTNTAMGKRMLRRWILMPLRSVDLINKRLDIVELFTEMWPLTNELELLLKSVHDIERLANRVASCRINPRELMWLSDSLAELPRIGDLLESTGKSILEPLTEGFYDCGQIAEAIAKVLTDEPPTTLREGGIIREGYNRTVDELRYAKSNSHSVIADMEVNLKQKTGINQLKIAYNRVQGYYIEITKSNLSKVPDWFERKGTLTNAERFVIPEIKDLEGKIKGTEERLNDIEYDLFINMRDQVCESVPLLRNTARNIARLDVYLSLARAAVVRGYKKPEVDDSGVIELTDARHPVVETTVKDPYVSNNAGLNEEQDRLMLITGPNMSGKSTYMRSVAMVALMAHMGSFVPASAAHIGVLDRIFTRVGANDNISRGESTFMVEMVETANILTHASKHSLIILDEIGRGTSTFDGISIAWAVAEHILRKVGAKTMFATHYHELTDIAAEGSGAKNYTVSVEEINGEICFLRRIAPGTADKSYGIYVAKLAGLPEEVTKRAQEVLNDLESDDNTVHFRGKPREVIVKQMLLFNEDHPAIEQLKELNINNLTPVAALNILSELKVMAENE